MSRASAIRLLLLDVDGVLTDGGLYLSDDGSQGRRFNVCDGLGIRFAQKAGLQVGILTGKESGAVRHRAAELGITLLRMGSKDKGADAVAMAAEAGVPAAETAFLGDDLIDLPAYRVVGYPMAVANARPEVKSAAAWIGSVPGGHGAAREAIEHILRARGQWEAILAHYRDGVTYATQA